MTDWIPNDEWETIVENVTIVSIDLIVECPEGIILGQRSMRGSRGVKEGKGTAAAAPDTNDST